MNLGADAQGPGFPDLDSLYPLRTAIAIMAAYGPLPTSSLHSRKTFIHTQSKETKKRVVPLPFPRLSRFIQHLLAHPPKPNGGTFAAISPTQPTPSETSPPTAYPKQAIRPISDYPKATAPYLPFSTFLAGGRVVLMGCSCSLDCIIIWRY